MIGTVLADHDNFIKTRRALIVSAVGVIVVTRLHLKNDVINIFDLQLLVSQDQLVKFGIMVTLYFCYLFIFHIKPEWERYQKAWIRKARDDKDWARAQTDKAYSDLISSLKLSQNQNHQKLLGQLQAHGRSKFNVQVLKVFEGNKKPNVYSFALREIVPTLFILFTAGLNVWMFFSSAGP